MRATAHSACRLGDVLDLSAGLIAVGLLALVYLGASGFLRILLALAFTFFVPGRAIVTNWTRMASWSRVAMPTRSQPCSPDTRSHDRVLDPRMETDGPVPGRGLAKPGWAVFRHRAQRTGTGWTVSTATGVAGAEKYAMTEAGAIWVGLLDMDHDRPRRWGERSSACPTIGRLVFWSAHTGHPWATSNIPTVPLDTLTVRARMAAETKLAEALRGHTHQDDLRRETGGSDEWAAQAACPLHFPTRDGAGVTITVCTRDRTKELRQCLRRLQKVTYDPLEIIVENNAPGGDATLEAVTALARSDPRIRYTCEQNPSLSRARNHGMTRARYDIVAFTDDDTMVDPGSGHQPSLPDSRPTRRQRA